MKKQIIILLILAIFVYFAGCTYIDTVKQSVENADKNTCCKSSFKNSPSCICPETTTIPINVTLTIVGKYNE